jgi:hypothetical protein
VGEGSRRAVARSDLRPADVDPAKRQIARHPTN